MRLMFCHGLESGPIGTKSVALRDAGYEVDAPDCRDMDLDARIGVICERIVATPDDPPVIVGSSFGGAAGLVAAIRAAQQGVRVPGLVLCAPALLRVVTGVHDLTPPAPITIVHGKDDEVIPIDVSREYAGAHRGVELVEVDDGHRLAAAGLDAILAAVRTYVTPPSSRSS